MKVNLTTLDAISAIFRQSRRGGWTYGRLCYGSAQTTYLPHGKRFL